MSRVASFAANRGAAFPIGLLCLWAGASLGDLRARLVERRQLGLPRHRADADFVLAFARFPATMIPAHTAPRRRRVCS